MRPLPDLLRSRTTAVGVLVVMALGLTAWAASAFGRSQGYQQGFAAGYDRDVADQSVWPSGTSGEMDFDVDRLLADLAEYQEGQAAHSPAFAQAIDDIHLALLENTARRYGLPAEDVEAVLSAYGSMRDSVVTMYFDGLQGMNAIRTNLGGSSEIETRYTDVSADFSAMLSDHACRLASRTISLGTMSSVGKPLLVETCSFLIADVVAPLAAELEERGLVRDIETAERVISEHARTAIAELATAEDRVHHVETRTFTRELLGGWYNPQARISASVIGTVKAGYNLQDGIDVTVNHDRRVISVRLPEATVLSNQTAYQILEDRSAAFNKMTTARRNTFQRDMEQRTLSIAIERGLLEAAESNAVETMRQLYRPLTMMPGPRYEIEVLTPVRVAPTQPAG